MKHCLYIISIALVFFLIGTSCSQDKPQVQSKQDVKTPKNVSVKTDFKRYIDNMRKLVNLETEALTAFNNQVDKNFKSDERLKQTLTSTTVPKMKQFKAKLDQLKPDSEEVMSIHKIYQKRTTMLLEAYEKMIVGLNKGDKTIISEAETIRQLSDLHYKEWNKKITEMIKK